MATNFEGKICPYCKCEFAPDDDIVVCSACDMPHHRDCWIENQGCTTFGCQGTIQHAGSSSTVTARELSYEEPAAPAAGVFCTSCGTRNAAGASFCTKCGTRLVTPGQPHVPPVQPQQTYTPPVQPVYTPPVQPVYTPPVQNQAAFQSAGVNLTALIGPKAEYYTPQFQKLRAKEYKTSWNWSAFLVAPYWMFYRKMYDYGGILLAVQFVLSLIGSPVVSVLSLCISIAAGIWGNFLYLQHLEKRMAQANSMTEPYKSQYIAKNSGANTTPAVLVAIGYAVLVGLLL